MLHFDLHSFLKQFLYDARNPLLFNNGFFVYFFAVFVGLFYSFRNNFKIRRYIFCFFSLYFFYKASGAFVILVVLSAIVDFFISNAIYKQQNKARKTLLLVSSIIFNLGMLFYFKYSNFFITVYNDLFNKDVSLLNILLPIGISFYTFENLSYTIDVYRGQFMPVKKFGDYLLFLSFFPKLVMGPIVRAHDFIPQINKAYFVSEKDFLKGFYLIISGLFKKLIISDYLTLNFVNYIFDDPARYSGIENIFAVYAYAVVIYCDFSGYSDIAIGIAKWLGFNIPTNFLSPYQSKNITEFWRRWHISLSSWLRDYLYIPLGGNKKRSFTAYLFAALFFAGIFVAGINLLHFSFLRMFIITGIVFIIFMIPAVIKNDRLAFSTNLNLLTTMLLGGLWHGANWNFILWGAFHGIGLAIHKIWMLLTGKSLLLKNNKLISFVSAIITFHFVCFCWIFFKTSDLTNASNMIQQIVQHFDLSVWGDFFAHYKPVLAMIGIAMTLHLIPDNYIDKFVEKSSRIPMIAYIIVFFAFVIVYGIFKTSEQVMPIYLRF